MLSGRDAGAGGWGARVGLARELPPQHGVGRPLALCVVPLGLAAAIRRLPWRCGGAARVGGPQDVRTGRQAAAEASWAGCLAPLGAVLGLRCSSFPVLLVLLAAPCVAGFLGSRWTCRLGLLGIYSVRATWQDVHGACAFPCVARERRSDATHPVLCCSHSSSGSFLTAFSRAVRGISH